MMGEDVGGMHSGAKRHRRRSLWQVWQKYLKKQVGLDGVRDPHIRSHGNSGEADREFRMLGRKREIPGCEDDFVR